MSERDRDIARRFRIDVFPNTLEAMSTDPLTVKARGLRERLSKMGVSVSLQTVKTMLEKEAQNEPSTGTDETD